MLGGFGLRWILIVCFGNAFFESKLRSVFESDTRFSRDLRWFLAFGWWSFDFLAPKKHSRSRVREAGRGAEGKGRRADGEEQRAESQELLDFWSHLLKCRFFDQNSGRIASANGDFLEICAIRCDPEGGVLTFPGATGCQLKIGSQDRGPGDERRKQPARRGSGFLAMRLSRSRKQGGRQIVERTISGARRTCGL